MVDLDHLLHFVAKLQNLHIAVLDHSFCKIWKLLLDILLEVQIHGKVYIELSHLLDFSSCNNVGLRLWTLVQPNHCIECWIRAYRLRAARSVLWNSFEECYAKRETDGCCTKYTIMVRNMEYSICGILFATTAMAHDVTICKHEKPHTSVVEHIDYFVKRLSLT